MIQTQFLKHLFKFNNWNSDINGSVSGASYFRPYASSNVSCYWFDGDSSRLRQMPFSFFALSWQQAQKYSLRQEASFLRRRRRLEGRVLDALRRRRTAIKLFLHIRVGLWVVPHIIGFTRRFTVFFYACVFVLCWSSDQQILKLRAFVLSCIRGCATVDDALLLHRRPGVTRRWHTLTAGVEDEGAHVLLSRFLLLLDVCVCLGCFCCFVFVLHRFYLSTQRPTYCRGLRDKHGDSRGSPCNCISLEMYIMMILLK